MHMFIFIRARPRRCTRIPSGSAMALMELAAVGALAVTSLMLCAEQIDPAMAVPIETVRAVVLGMLGFVCLLMVMGGGSKKPSGALTTCPATSWPAGKPMLASPADYPTYDHTGDPKGSFMKICDMLIAEVKDELPKMYELPERENEWINKMLKYNTVGGKMTRGLMVVEAGVTLFKARGLTVDNTTMCKFGILGWCIEWLQAWLLVADDMMDESVTRRGQPCWYKCKGVGNIAINDAVTIEALVFKILKRHFAKVPCACAYACGCAHMCVYACVIVRVRVVVGCAWLCVRVRVRV